MHERNSFLTLTYAVDPISLDVDDLQRFFKRLRNSGLSVRHYSCGEYGERLGRPHFHVLLFGEDFSYDRYPWRFENGNQIYRSPSLERAWDRGQSEIGSVTFESASYVAGYVQKKLTGEVARDHYIRVDPETGEAHEVKPEFSVMSRGGRYAKARGEPTGIGSGWLSKFREEVLRDDSVLSRGRLVQPPRYYDTLNEQVAPERLAELKAERVKAAKARSEDNSPERLQVREQVARARASLKRRRYET